MPTPPRWFVWEWLDEENQVRFLGKGNLQNEENPADVLWDKRREMNSPLGHWLCGMTKQPKRSDQVITQAMYESNAEALYTQRLRQHKKANVDLLSTRPFGTWAGGGGRRAIISPEGDVYESVRQAAQETGVAGATITRYCQKADSGWVYA